MNTYTQPTDLTLIGTKVSNFPSGIQNAFQKLGVTLGTNRAFYGVSWMDEHDNIVYYTMAAEALPGEGDRYQYERLIMEKGEYRTESLHNWMSQTDCIKDIFHRLMGGDKPGKDHPCIEWYQSLEEMLCMIRNK